MQPRKIHKRKRKFFELVVMHSSYIYDCKQEGKKCGAMDLTSYMKETALYFHNNFLEELLVGRWVLITGFARSKFRTACFLPHLVRPITVVYRNIRMEWKAEMLVLKQAFAAHLSGCWTLRRPSRFCSNMPQVFIKAEFFLNEACGTDKQSILYPMSDTSNIHTLKPLV